MQKPNNKNNKDQNTPQFGVVNYGPENIGREVFYSDEENKLLHRSLVADSKKYLDTELAYKLKKKDINLYKVLYTNIPRSIQNYDFYMAFRNVKINELVNLPDENEKTLVQKIKETVIVYDESRYKKGFPISEYENEKYTDKDKYPIQWGCTIIVIIYILYIVFCVAALAFLGITIAHLILSNFPAVATFVKVLAVIGFEALLIYFFIKIFKKRYIRKLKNRKNTKNIKKLKNNHPYYKLCDDLHYYSIRFTNILHPVNKIEETYKKNRKGIEKEWTKYSENAFTNILFRFRPIKINTDYNYFFRLFIEIDYKECFPNYPELLNIEQQTLPFIYGLFNDCCYDNMIPGYKKQIENYISNLLSERIPDMEVKDIKIAVVRRKP